MKGYIFISKIFEQGDDYQSLKDSFDMMSKNFSIDEMNSHLLVANYFSDSNILLIKGKNFYNSLDGKSYLRKITDESYNKLIDNITRVYNGIKENPKNPENQLKEFNEVFKPEETIICIHWGGGTSKNEEVNKVLEDMLKKDKDQKVYKITYFTSSDDTENNFYNKLTSKNKDGIIKALKFYIIKTENNLVKKNIYELMEKIYFYHFPFINKKINIDNTNPFYQVIKEEIDFLVTIKNILIDPDAIRITKDFLNHFPNIGTKIEIDDVEMFRKKTYEYLNYTTFPIYPKSLK